MPDPPVATMPVSAGMEKYAPSQAAGADVVMVASLVSVTVSVPLSATVSGAASVWTLPDVEVASAHGTSLVVAEHPEIVPVRFEAV